MSAAPGHHPECEGCAAPPAAPAPAEALTLDRLLRTVAQVALTTYDDRLDTCAGPAAEDRAIESTAALLTPRARLELAAELLAPLPGVVHADVALGAEAVALVRELPGAAPVRFAHADHTTEGYTAQVGRLTVRATARREATEEERQALAAAEAERPGCVMLPAT